MVPGKDTVKLVVANVHLDGELRTRRDVELRIVGDFALLVGGVAIYRESEFCLVEFGLAMGKWLTIAGPLGPDFVYTSLESDTEGLVRFERKKPNLWHVAAAFQTQESGVLITTAEIKAAALKYLHELRDVLLPIVDLSQYIDDTSLRIALRHFLR